MYTYITLDDNWFKKGLFTFYSNIKQIKHKPLKLNYNLMKQIKL